MRSSLFKVASCRSRRVHAVVMTFLLVQVFISISALSSKPELRALALAGVIIPPHTEVCPPASVLGLAAAFPRPLPAPLEALTPSLCDPVSTAAMD